MKKERSRYDHQFKLMAVELVKSGKSTGQVAEDLGIRRDLVTRWKREFRQGSLNNSSKPSISAERKENLRLKKALRIAQLENEILKKAVGIFSKSDGKSFNS